MTSDTMLGITNLHNGIILSILSINSRDFTFSFLKMSRTNRDVFLIHKLIIILLISQRGTPSHYKDELKSTRTVIGFMIKKENSWFGSIRISTLRSR